MEARFQVLSVSLLVFEKPQQSDPTFQWAKVVTKTMALGSCSCYFCCSFCFCSFLSYYFSKLWTFLNYLFLCSYSRTMNYELLSIWRQIPNVSHSPHLRFRRGALVSIRLLAKLQHVRESLESSHERFLVFFHLQHLICHETFLSACATRQGTVASLMTKRLSKA